MTTRRRVLAGGILLGVGFGGFIDGIVLHQILQWHHMLSDHGDYPVTTVAGLEANTLADGLFHASTWIAAFVGMYLVWSALRDSALTWSTRAFTGLLLLGWGLFNTIEGIANHQVLGLHHVNETVSAGDQPLWDYGFLAVGVALIAIGGALARQLRHAEASPR